MTRYDAPYEIHLHGEVQVREDVSATDVEESLRPLWNYAGVRSMLEGASSLHQEEPGIMFDPERRVIQMCWTVQGDDDFRQTLDDVCMGLNDVASQGAALEVTFYDVHFDQDEEEDDDAEQADEAQSRDDFMMLFVGPTPAAIMQVQRDLLVHDVLHLMERHFDPNELGGVVEAIDQLFGERFDALVNSLELGKPPRGSGGGSGGLGHGGGRRPRHLH
ncbi:MAG: hypothetical protein EBV20_00450 [Betaproteobacteria bacterium]|jgi:hypothetical protein|nr:hypothetical protein [Betaproteobacteria bacterium]NBP45204.1 hypothetical protein [Betaproteobacteria bacterium]